MIDRKPFLQQVAEDIAKNFSKAEFADTKIILPSKRIRLFFNKYLSQLQTPISVEEEQYSTISELLFSFSDLRPIGITEPTEKIKLVAELYRVYIKIFESTETFDDFYFLGEILLEDFNAIDKYLVDADKLFGNLSALEKYKSFDYLNTEQRDVIRKFFNKDTVLKERFFDFWDKLNIVYQEYGRQLEQNKIAYEGMFLKQALSEAEAYPEKFENKKYIFIGFDFVDKIEERLFSLLKKQDKAVFYNDDIGVSDFSPNISVIKAAGMSAQAEIIPEWLKKISRKNKEATDAAIILCDEKILPIVINVIPEEEQPNTAILFDLVQTPLAVCLMRVLMDAPAGASVKTLQELLQKEISSHNRKKQEVVFIEKMLDNLNSVLANESIQMEPATFIKLLRRILISMKIPYLGEPAKGLQILAPVDTKNMDFKHILMLSVNEGKMPKTGTDSSFIPPFIRRHFDMPTPDDEQRQQAYLFWHLLKRSNSATIVYCEGKTLTSKNEKSRFIRQLQLEYGEDVQELLLQAPFMQTLSTKTLLMQDLMQKTPVMLQKISEKTFSPSMLNAYIDCSLRFYLKYVLGATDSSEKNELNAAVLGSVFHRSIEMYYRKEFLDVSGNGAGNGACGGEESSEKIIEQAFTEILNKENIKLSKDKEGEKHIYTRVIEKMFNNTIAYDSTQPFEIVDMENEDYKWQILLNNGNKINIGGTIDRIDRKDEIVRIVDYKTGIMPDSKKFKSDYDTEVSGIFSPERKKKSSYLLQILLYSYCYSKNNPCVKTVSPILYFPLKNNESETPVLDVSNYDYVEFERYLKAVLENIFDISKPFRKCENEDMCKYCDYKLLCARN
jgi:CRISPR/Cas system-associated exonuclease Cas4 (RecB family)